MTLLLFLLLLSVLVFVHELGHFLLAKKNGILVEEFGFGLPPRIWGKKMGETVYSINLLPIGGFVKLYGEDGGDGKMQKNKDARMAGRAFWEKSIPQRASVIAAGVIMNFLLAVLVFSAVYLVTGIPTRTNKIKIVELTKDSPADSAGLKIADEILVLDGRPVQEIEDFIKITKDKAGGAIELEIKRDKDNPCRTDQNFLDESAAEGSSASEISCRGDNLLVTLIPRVSPPEGEGPLGIAISNVEMKRYAFWQMPFYGVREGFKESLAWGGIIFKALTEMLRDLILFHRVPKDVSGPIGIYQATGLVAQSGILAVLQFLGILSVNLAIINILPLPALDGGRLFFLGLEAFLGKKIPPKIENWVNSLGMALLLLLLLVITINDLIRIFLVNNIFERIKMLF